jgi:hypothetical protein
MIGVDFANFLGIMKNVQHYFQTLIEIFSYGLNILGLFGLVALHLPARIMWNGVFRLLKTICDCYHSPGFCCVHGGCFERERSSGRLF